MTDFAAAPRWTPARSFGLKLLLVCALAVLMAIPALTLFALIYDREHRANQVRNEIGELAGGSQVAIGPVLIAPYLIAAKGEDDAATQGLYVVFADQGSAKASASVQTRRRSIYAAQVYETTLDFEARFTPPQTPERLPADAVIDWSQARVVLALSNLRGVKNEAAVTFADGAVERFAPTGALSGVTWPVARETGGSLSAFNDYGGGAGEFVAARTDGRATPGQPLDVSTSLVVSGSERLSIAPFAKATTIAIDGDWPDPSFGGGFLPDERAVRDDGFDATWSISSLARATPGEGPLDAINWYQLASRDAAVRFVIEADPYRNVTRSLKYGVLFIGLVFLAFFLFEATSGRRVHAAQYVLVGLAQAVFYVLLLAVAEHLGFDLAFLVAGGATTLLTAAYAGSAFGGVRFGVRALIVFSAVYGLLYALMRLEDYALLIGALSAFGAIAATMFVTRDIDWYGDRRRLDQA